MQRLHLVARGVISFKMVKVVLLREIKPETCSSLWSCVQWHNAAVVQCSAAELQIVTKYLYHSSQTHRPSASSYSSTLRVVQCLLQYSAGTCSGILYYSIHGSNERAMLVFISVDTVDAVEKHNTI